MNLPAGLPITAEDWEKTPLSVQTLVITLWEENQILKAQVARLQSQVETLQSDVKRLNERLDKNSQNSSKPPSSDPPQKPKYPKAELSGEKKGGRKGHHGHGRKLKSPDQINRIVKSVPSICKDCGAVLKGEDARPERHQVSELPKIVPEIVEYQRHTLHCENCGAKNRAEWPVEMPKGSFGERLQAMIGYLGGRFGISHRDMSELMETVFGVEISLGSIPAQQQRVSMALKEPVEAAEKYVKEQKAVNLDETGWHEMVKDFWLWVCATPDVSVFRIFDNRSANGAKTLLGENYAGIVGSDRFGAYSWIDPFRRQICWAHLKRDFQALVERGDESKIVGQMLLARLKTFFGFWHRFREGSLMRLDLQTLMHPIREEIQNLLEIGTLLGHKETRRTCQNILKVKQALWTFVDEEGVEPTNNAAERALRRGVIWRKHSFGTQSKNGTVFVERILTTVMTLRQQKRNVLDYLTTVCKVATAGLDAPTLLPTEWMR
jgi:transposase